MKKSASLLAIGDVHLGTACSGVPEEISSFGVSPKKLTPAAALKLSVNFAIENQVDVVMFAGDVVESTNARFEAMLPLEENIRRLLHAGIQVIAVAGNHDVEALPRLADMIDGFCLLGAGGQWEAKIIRKNQIPVAQVIGWSFGEKHVRQSPVAQLLEKPLEKPSIPVPRIGLLHADLNASGGRYAPIRRAELDDTGYDAWLLGHIHKPSLKTLSTSSEVRPFGYLGSLVGLDPSETGPHGPWHLTISTDGKLQLNQVPLAPLRWEYLSVSVDGLEYVDDLQDKLLDQAKLFVRQLGKSCTLPRALGLRVRLNGESTQYEQIRNWIDSAEWRTLGRVIDDTAVFFNKIIDSMDLHLDLKDIAKGDDPPALVAKRILILQGDNEQSRTVLKNARSNLSNVADLNIWAPLQDHRNAKDPLSDDCLRDMLIQSGKLALNHMLSRHSES